jgi:hypothetical protein
LKEFIICYTLENEIKRERVIKEQGTKKEEVLQEILKKLQKYKTLHLEGDKGNNSINSSIIRYIKVHE